MSEHEETTEVQVNPLIFLSLDPVIQRAQGRSGEVEASALLRDLRVGQTLEDLEKVAQRYAVISKLDSLVQIVLHDQRILEKIIWPLRSAKKAYVLGDYLACVALAGSIGEMVASFVFDLAGVRLGGKPLTAKQQTRLFGRPFEELSQYRRVDILHAFGLWDAGQVQKATELRKIRNKYLHRLSAELTGIEKKAACAYRLAVELAGPVVGLPLGKGGSIVLDPKLREYLRRTRGSEP